jgi:hypothetical protein
MIGPDCIATVKVIQVATPFEEMLPYCRQTGNYPGMGLWDGRGEGFLVAAEAKSGSNTSPYLWTPTPPWSVQAGTRRKTLLFYITINNDAPTQ